MKYFKAILSNRQEVILDEHDYEKLVQGMNVGAFVKLNKAIINPSFLQCVLPIEQREALGAEKIERKVEGYIDEETKSFVVTSDIRPLPVSLTDEFAK